MDMFEKSPAILENFEIKCTKCEKEFSDKELDKIIYLENCSHVVCMECIKSEIKEHFPDVECPDKDCATLLPEWEIS